MNRVSSIATSLGMVVVLCGAQGECANNNQPPSIAREKQMQETVMAESVAQVGMPAIKNFREKKLLKDIFELRGLRNYTMKLGQDEQVTITSHNIGPGDVIKLQLMVFVTGQGWRPKPGCEPVDITHYEAW